MSCPLIWLCVGFSVLLDDAEYEKEERVEILTTFYATYDPSKSASAISDLVEKAKRALLRPLLLLFLLVDSDADGLLLDCELCSGKVSKAVSPALCQVYAPFSSRVLSPSNYYVA